MTIITGLRAVVQMQGIQLSRQTVLQFHSFMSGDFQIPAGIPKTTCQRVLLITFDSECHDEQTDCIYSRLHTRMNTCFAQTKPQHDSREGVSYTVYHNDQRLSPVRPHLFNSFPTPGSEDSSRYGDRPIQGLTVTWPSRAFMPEQRSFISLRSVEKVGERGGVIFQKSI